MRSESHGVGARYLVDQHADQVRAFARRGVANRVGDVDRRRAALDRGLDDAAEVVVFRPRRVHRRPLHVVAEVAGMRHRVVDTLDHLVLVEVRDRPVQGRGANKGMDARAPGVAYGFPTAVDVPVVRARQPADHCRLRAFCNIRHRREVALRGDREPGLDDVDAPVIEQLGDLELFVVGHRRAG